MAKRRLDEELKGAGHQMDRVGGDEGGLVKKSIEKADLPDYETGMKSVGKEWPRKHNDTPAMCDADEDGVEHEPQGVHNSEHGEPEDGITKKAGHDWPAEPKNGGGTMEPFGNKLPTGNGLQGGDEKAFQPPKGSAHNSHQSESWDPSQVGSLMSESEYDDEQLQSLFDSYARENRLVSLEDFSRLLDAHGVNNLLDEHGFVNLLARNAEFTFHEQEDSDGRYWLAEGMPEFLKKKLGKKGEEGDDEEDVEECSGGKKSAFLKKVRKECSGGMSEFLKNKLGKKGKEGDDEEDVEECSGGKKSAFLKKVKKECSKTCKEWLEVAEKVVATHRRGRITEEDAARALHISLNCSLTREDVRNARPAERQAINKIAKAYGIRFDESVLRLAEGPFDLGGPAGPAAASAAHATGAHGGFDPNDPNALPMDDDYGFDEPGLAGAGAPMEPGLGGEYMAGPAGKAGLGDPATGGDLGGDLGEPGVEDLPGAASEPAGGAFVKPQQPLGGSPRRRASRAVSEDYPTGNGLEGGTWNGEVKGAGHKMDHAGDGSAVEGGKAKKTKDLPQDDTDTFEIKPKNLLGARQKNTTKDSQEFEWGGAGKLSSEDGLRENLQLLAKFVRGYLAERDHGLRGKYSVSFNTKVGGKRVSSHPALADVIADSEELILLYGPDRVVLEAVYSDPRTGRPVKSVDIKLPAVRRNSPMVSEGKVLFRFNRHAERFAEHVMAEGVVCRLTSHNWGAAVHTGLSPRKLQRIFGAIIKR